MTLTRALLLSAGAVSFVLGVVGFERLLAAAANTRTGWSISAITRCSSSSSAQPPDRAVVCHDDEEYALKTGITAEVPWERLPLHLRRTNRDQAEDIGRKLTEIACLVIPRMGPDLDDVLLESEIDRLARLEHDRWCRAYFEAGWRYAPSATTTSIFIRDWCHGEASRIHSDDVRMTPCVSFPSSWRTRVSGSPGLSAGPRARRSSC